MNGELVKLVEDTNKQLQEEVSNVKSRRKNLKHFPQTIKDEERRRHLVSVVGPQGLPHEIEGYDKGKVKPRKLSNREEPTTLGN